MRLPCLAVSARLPEPGRGDYTPVVQDPAMSGGRRGPFGTPGRS